MLPHLRKWLESKQPLFSGQADAVSELGHFRLLLLLLLLLGASLDYAARVLSMTLRQAAWKEASRVRTNL